MGNSEDKKCFKPNGDKSYITRKELYDCLSDLEDKLDKHHDDLINQISIRIVGNTENIKVVDKKLEKHKEVDKIIAAILGLAIIIIPSIMANMNLIMNKLYDLLCRMLV